MLLSELSHRIAKALKFRMLPTLTMGGSIFFSQVFLKSRQISIAQITEMKDMTSDPLDSECVTDTN